VKSAALDQYVALAPVNALMALDVQDARRIYEQRFDQALADAVGQLRIFEAVVAGMTSYPMKVSALASSPPRHTAVCRSWRRPWSQTPSTS
jgi:hypothetical protein